LEETFYQILGLSVKATEDEIKSAYKRLARKYHPDVNQGSKSHEEQFKRVLEAYQTLSDPRKKDLYDVKLLYRTITNSGQANSDSIYRGAPKTRRQKEAEEYSKRRPEREAYRAYTGPPIKEKITLHSAAITLLGLGTVVMLLLWFGDIMNHIAAKDHLERGEYSIALQFDDEYGEAYYARYLDRKKYTNNLKILLNDLNLAIRFIDNPNSSMFIERAKIYFQMDSIPNSISDFLYAKTVNNKCDTAFFALAELYAYHLNQPKKALNYYDSTLMLTPNSYQASFGKGFMLYRLKKFSLAIKEFDYCFTLNNEDKRLYFYRGSAKLATGDSANACADLDMSLTMGMEEAKPLVDRFCLGILY